MELLILILSICIIALIADVFLIIKAKMKRNFNGTPTKANR